MIASEDRAALDIAIEGSLARIRDRAAELGDGFAALGEAIGRAARGGKRFRPALVTASFRAFGGDPASTPSVMSVAAAFELLHTAFVVHDDVIDHDIVRRGVPNIGGEFRRRGQESGADAEGAATLGDAAAILAGDLLLHEAMRLVAMADVPPSARERLLELVDDAVLVSAAGELADVEQGVATECADADRTLDTAYNKTAVYSFRAPLQAGAVLAGADADAVRVLGHAGGALGLAFQLIDDLIGAFGTEEQAGRDSGGDLREAKRTPLVALARESASWPEVSQSLTLARTGPIALQEAQLALAQSGARERLLEVVFATIDDVRTTAEDDLLPERARALLTDLATALEARIP